jgi:phosphoribosyl 1,2-cyclic phosphodiesterase
MKVTVLGSGSEGNSTLIEVDGTGILVDAGFSGRETEERLRACGFDPRWLAGIVVTHDHGDHSRGAGILARRFGVPVYLTKRTAVALSALFTGGEAVREYASSAPFRIGPLTVNPFLTVHDAVDPVAVTVLHPESGSKVGIVTDVGRPTTAVRAALAGCHALVLEANHDDAMLWRGPYPWSVKQRIASSHVKVMRIRVEASNTSPVFSRSATTIKSSRASARLSATMAIISQYLCLRSVSSMAMLAVEVEIRMISSRKISAVLKMLYSVNSE